VAGILTVGQVTRFLRDFPSYNILLADVQFSDEDVDEAMSFAIDEYNGMTPVTLYTPENFPNRYLLLIGTCKHLMRSESFLQLRNQLTYQDGDVASIGVDDKFAAYTNIHNDLNAKWTEMGRAIKTQMNMEQGYGRLSSGYAHIRTGIK